MTSKELQSRLKLMGYSFADVSRLMGIPQQNLYSRCLSKNGITLDTLEQIAKALNCDVCNLLGKLPIHSIEDYDELCSLRTRVQCQQEEIRRLYTILKLKGE